MSQIIAGYFSNQLYGNLTKLGWVFAIAAFLRSLYSVNVVKPKWM
ncbi:hypothetical protein [Leptolyngbya sp. Cla-17]|nr:hypothetical protein [Leptolyngbya sp. Cla-17]